MSLITNNSTPAERQRGCTFSEKFENAAKVIRNGGVIVSAPTINNGLTTDGTDDEVTYAEDIKNVQSISFWVTLQTTTEDIMQLSSSHSIEAGTGTLTATGVTSPTFYVNGVATATITTARSHVVITTGTAFDADAIQIGQDDAFGQFKIEDLKMWTAELTADEVTDLYNDDTYRYINEAVLDLPMGMAEHDPTNTRTLDLSVTANHPTWTGSAEPVKLTDKHGYTFDGVDDYFEVAHNANQLLTTGMTISAWIRPVSGGEGATSNGGRIVDKSISTNGNDGFRFNVANSTNTLRFQVNSGTEIISDTNFDRDSGMWSHVAVTVASDATTTFYIDGVVSGTPGATGALSGITTTTAMRIGNRAGGDDRTFDGDIARLKIWSSDLTALQIKDLYQKEFKKINDI